jgi:hypothetical protein
MPWRTGPPERRPCSACTHHVAGYPESWPVRVGLGVMTCRNNKQRRWWVCIHAFAPCLIESAILQAFPYNLSTAGFLMSSRGAFRRRDGWEVLYDGGMPRHSTEFLMLKQHLVLRHSGGSRCDCGSFVHVFCKFASACTALGCI